MDKIVASYILVMEIKETIWEDILTKKKWL